MTRTARAYRMMAAATVAVMLWGIALPVVHLVCAMETPDMKRHCEKAAASDAVHDHERGDAAVHDHGHVEAPVHDDAGVHRTLHEHDAALEHGMAAEPGVLNYGPETDAPAHSERCLPVNDDAVACCYTGSASAERSAMLATAAPKEMLAAGVVGVQSDRPPADSPPLLVRPKNAGDALFLPCTSPENLSVFLI